MKDFNIESIINELKEKRALFFSEADLQLAMAMIIKEKYPNAKVWPEYSPEFNSKMHIDILVIIDGKWFPIELKYKTKGCKKSYQGETYILKNHGAKDVNCYLYLKDIQRIELIKKEVPYFREGYTLFFTNDMTYEKPPRKENCFYREFSLHQGIKKTGIMKWDENASEGTKRYCKDDIELQDEYEVKWRIFSTIDESQSGTFMYLVNRIKK